MVTDIFAGVGILTEHGDRGFRFSTDHEFSVTVTLHTQKSEPRKASRNA